MTLQTQYRLSLTLLDGDDELDCRTTTLTPNLPVILGRASKDSSKNLFSDISNLWLTSPVISRNHAQFTCSTNDIPAVYIEDLKSSHGTYIIGSPDKPCKQGQREKITDGDVVRFGAKVTRGSEEFHPPIFKIHISKSIKNLPFPQPSDSFPTPTTPGKSFIVPDDSSENESDMDIAGDSSTRSEYSESPSVLEIENPYSSDHPDSPVYSPQSPSLYIVEHEAQLDQPLYRAPSPYMPSVQAQNLAETKDSEFSDSEVEEVEDEDIEVDDSDKSDHVDEDLNSSAVEYDESIVDDGHSHVQMKQHVEVHIPAYDPFMHSSSFVPPTFSFTRLPQPDWSLGSESNASNGYAIGSLHSSMKPQSSSRRMNISSLLSQEYSTIAPSRKRAYSDIDEYEPPEAFNDIPTSHQCENGVTSIRSAQSEHETEAGAAKEPEFVTISTQSRGMNTTTPATAEQSTTTSRSEEQPPRKRSRLGQSAKNVGIFVAGSVATVLALLYAPELSLDSLN